MAKPKPIVINGIQYESISEAAKIFNISNQLLRWRLKNNKNIDNIGNNGRDLDPLALIKEVYRKQKSNSIRRKIEWQFTFEEWKQKWDESGKWALRGSTKDKPYVMCRNGDIGPYSYDNTYIGTIWENQAEWQSRKPKKSKKEYIKKGRPKTHKGKECEYNGIVYKSIKDAAIANGLTPPGMKYKLDKIAREKRYRKQ